MAYFNDRTVAVQCQLDNDNPGDGIHHYFVDLCGKNLISYTGKDGTYFYTDGTRIDGINWNQITQGTYTSNKNKYPGIPTSGDSTGLRLPGTY